MKTTEPFNEKEFAPRISLSERYSIEYMAKAEGLSIEEFKDRINEKIKIKNDLIKNYLNKGCTQEQAETMALRILYLPGFSGPTFKDL